MSEGPNRGSSGILGWLCWLPLASLLAVESYIRNFDGWGAWSAAPILLVPAVVSLAIVLPALLDCVAGIRAGTLRPRTVLFTVVASLPMLWLSVRRHVL